VCYAHQELKGYFPRQSPQPVAKVELSAPNHEFISLAMRWVSQTRKYMAETLRLSAFPEWKFVPNNQVEGQKWMDVRQ
jgi:hypothetical protein